MRRILDAAGIRRPASAFAASRRRPQRPSRRCTRRRSSSKIVAEGVQHKTDVDGIRRGIESAREAEIAFEEIRDAAVQHGLERQFVGVTVEEQIGQASSA